METVKMTEFAMIGWILAAWLLGVSFGWSVGSFLTARKLFKEFVETIVEADNGRK